MTEEISPIEAGLTWTIGKSRREDCAFLGGDRIKRELAEGVKQKRIGLLTQGPPARAHSDLLEPESCRKVRSHIKSLLHVCVCPVQIGEVTSGAFSPNLEKNIAMGYLEKAFAKKTTAVKVMVRNKQYDAVVTGMPFVPTSYYRPK